MQSVNSLWRVRSARPIIGFNPDFHDMLSPRPSRRLRGHTLPSEDLFGGANNYLPSTAKIMKPNGYYQSHNSDCSQQTHKE